MVIVLLDCPGCGVTVDVGCVAGTAPCLEPEACAARNGFPQHVPG